LPVASLFVDRYESSARRSVALWLLQAPPLPLLLLLRGDGVHTPALRVH
jgi:hypothetical protein